MPSECFTPVPFFRATPVESSIGGPLRGIQQGTAGRRFGGVKAGLAECEECGEEIFFCKKMISCIGYAVRVSASEHALM